LDARERDERAGDDDGENQPEERILPSRQVRI
jgi:hypothetical protein